LNKITTSRSPAGAEYALSFAGDKMQRLGVKLLLIVCIIAVVITQVSHTKNIIFPFRCNKDYYIKARSWTPKSRKKRSKSQTTKISE